MLPRTYILWLTGFFLLTLASLSKAEPAAIKGILLEEFEPFHPLINQRQVTHQLEALVHRSILSRDRLGRWQSDFLRIIPLHKSDLILPPGQGGMIVPLHLSDEAKWGDGEPITGEDLIFSLELGKSLATALPLGPAYQRIEKITLDTLEPRKKLYVHFKQFTWQYLYDLMSLRLLPHHLESHLFQPFRQHQQAEVNAAESNYMRQPSLAGLYNGPYRIATYQPGQNIILERNPYYPKPTRYEKITLQHLALWGEIEKELRNLSCDLIMPAGFSWPLARRLEDLIHERKLPYRLISQASATYELLAVQSQHQALKNPKVRQALQLSLDLDSLRSSLWGGYAFKTFGHEASLGQRREIASPRLAAYTPTKAIQLLKEAGWRQDKNGNFRDQKGKRIELRLLTNAYSDERKHIAQWAKAHWEKIGLASSLRFLGGEQLFAKNLRSEEVQADMVLLAANTSFPLIFSEALAYQWQSHPFLTNPSRLLHPWQELITHPLWTEFLEEDEGAKRLSLLQRLQAHWLQEALVIPILIRPRFSLLSSQLALRDFEEEGLFKSLQNLPSGD